MEVYRLHTEYVSATTSERRKQSVEDVRKRSEYRKAHGLEKEGLFGSWTARTDEETMGAGMREGGGAALVAASEPEPSPIRADEQVLATPGAQGDFVDFEGKKRPVKKWLGIW